MRECKRCHGYGLILDEAIDDFLTCPDCNGAGEVEDEITQDDDITERFRRETAEFLVDSGVFSAFSD